MKKFLTVALLGIASYASNAQNQYDVMQFAQNNLYGTARYNALSGAMSALGGDLSAISLNPAGSAIFLNNQFGISLSNYNVNNKSTYLGNNNTGNETSFDINQIGGVAVFVNDDENSKWKKITLAVNYDNQGTFNNNLRINGVNQNTSVSQFFLNQANGVPLELLQLQTGETQGSLYSYLGSNYGLSYQNAFLGYDTYIIEATDNSLTNTSYYSNVPEGEYYQASYINSTGFNGKLAFNLGTQYTDRFYFGLNLNAHIVDQNKTTYFYETNENTPNPQGETVRDIQLQNDLYTYGSGFSFQLGTIAKVTEDFRVGLSYESPTWYRLTDELIQSISVTRDGTTVPAYFDQGIVNIFPAYKIQTPSRYSLGLAYVFDKLGFLSIDYGLKDYSETRIKPKNNGYFNLVNQTLRTDLRAASEFRVGFETKYKNLSFRVGYRLEESPYKDANVMGDLEGYSAGIGVNLGRTKIDLGYSFNKRDYSREMFDTGLTDSYKVTSKNNNLFLTLAFEL